MKSNYKPEITYNLNLQSAKLIKIDHKRLANLYKISVRQYTL